MPATETIEARPVVGSVCVRRGSGELLLSFEGVSLEEEEEAGGGGGARREDEVANVRATGEDRGGREGARRCVGMRGLVERGCTRAAARRRRAA